MNGRASAATPRFLDALSYAVRLHGADYRRCSTVPCVAHLLGACALVLADGGTEEEAIAALLHDALEDHPEDTSPDEIAARFGDEVVALVQACTDTPRDYKGGKKPPWRQRKTAYVEHLRRAGPRERRVALADKLDNLRSILADYPRQGEQFWARFHAGKEDQLWLFRSLSKAFREAGATGHLMEEFERCVSKLERLAGST
jgi:(p)ppGpp synthase/HD superfamily hydrolase